MKDVDEIITKMEQASGFPRDEILSRSRKTPLPALRWFIGQELTNRGYSINRAAIMIGINHATLLHGLKVIPTMERDKHWIEEYNIQQEFQALCR